MARATRSTLAWGREAIVSLTQTEIMLVFAVVILLLLLAKNNDLADATKDVEAVKRLKVALEERAEATPEEILEQKSQADLAREVKEVLVRGGAGPTSESETRRLLQPSDVAAIEEALQGQRQQTESQLQDWLGVIEEFEAPSEIETLRQRKEIAEAASRRDRARAEVLEEIVEASGEEGRAAVDAVERAFADAERAPGEAHEAAVRVAREKARRELHLLRKKGINPPCWYQMVPTASGSSREKPHYTFNVAIFDDWLEVRRTVWPSGGSVDDGTMMYADEAAALDLGSLPYRERLSDAAFIEHFRRIADAAKNKRVRSYPCIFWVRVWDRTSPTAKRRWQRAHDGIVESLFGTYAVQDDPWPGDVGR